jgi:hypothetical protein
MQRLLDNHFLLLFIGVVVPTVLSYLGDLGGRPDTHCELAEGF